ncbi:MAG: hypothetical protein WAN81_21215 [Candidatus Binataceae bacterium]
MGWTMLWVHLNSSFSKNFLPKFLGNYYRGKFSGFREGKKSEPVAYFLAAYVRRALPPRDRGNRALVKGLKVSGDRAALEADPSTTAAFAQSW